MILMVGSYGAGISCQVNRFPEPGETVSGAHISIGHGGKTSNQAVAAARQGGDVSILSVLGRDQFADNALLLWQTEKIEASQVEIRDGRTMAGTIMVDAEGENRIAIDGGVLDDFSPTDIDRHVQLFEEASTVVLSLEIPPRTVERAITLAKERGAAVVLNPAPAKELDSVVLRQVDYLIPNETEYKFLLERGYVAPADQMLIVTLGKHGAQLHSGKDLRDFRPYVQKEVVDTTGAGDTFVGTFAAAIDRGDSVDNAIESAIVASSLAVTKAEVIPATPTADDVNENLTIYKDQN